VLQLTEVQGEDSPLQEEEEETFVEDHSEDLLDAVLQGEASVGEAGALQGEEAPQEEGAHLVPVLALGHL